MSGGTFRKPSEAAARPWAGDELFPARAGSDSSCDSKSGVDARRMAMVGVALSIPGIRTIGRCAVAAFDPHSHSSTGGGSLGFVGTLQLDFGPVRSQRN